MGWRDVTIRLPVKTGGCFGILQKDTGKQKLILDGVSGVAYPGELVFIMGPSGSGKSTLLDSLADRVKLNVEGTQVLDGEPKTERKLKNVAKYVQQSDDLYGVLTVEETLNFAASLYTSKSSEKAQKVKQVLAILGLEEQRGTKVGSPFFRGLSGGQKRRLSVGCELVADPKMLFLDEPTSGLDSASAFALTKCLRELAVDSGTTILCTIHQPGELVFEMADKLILLSGGKQIYFGTADGAADYFASLGYNIPPRTSQAEWMIDLINADFGNAQVVEELKGAWPVSEQYKQLTASLEEIGCSAPTGESKFVGKKVMTHIKEGNVKFPTNQLWATLVLGHRNAINNVRNPAVMWLRFAMYVALALMIGTIWLRLPYRVDVIPDVSGALFYIVAFMVFMSISVLPAYIEERAIVIKERANGAYGVIAYHVAHLLVELPTLLFLAFVAGSISYWLINLNNAVERYFFFILTLWLSFLVAESIMVVIATLVPIFIIGIAIGAFTFGAFMCVMGFFIKFDQIGWWWKWLRYVALHYYAFASLMWAHFDGLNYAASPPGKIPEIPALTGEQILTSFELQNTRIGVNTVILVAMVIVLRLFAMMWMYLFQRGKK